MTDNNIFLKFAKIYIDGTACDGCKYEPNASCSERYEECAKRMSELLEQNNDR